LLKKRNLIHTVLNAKYHEKEAEIIARAGQPGAVTIATNMAGRGTDIVLGEGMKEKGGLLVLGTERHESRRIDNQLRGRCARQGDPGASKFYVSLEDELMRLFGSERISMMMQRLGMEEGDEIQHPMVNKTLETAQKRVEGHHFSIRKHLLEYDDVMNRQRELIYAERDRVLRGEKLREHFFEMLENVIEDLVSDFMHPSKAEHDRDPQGLSQALSDKFAAAFEAAIEENGHDTDMLLEALEKRTKELFEEKEKMMGVERMQMLLQYIMLQVIDSKWKEHLYNLDHLKEGIGLRAYGQRDPLVEYKREAFDLFEDVTSSVKHDVIGLVYRVQGVEQGEPIRAATPKVVEYIHPEAQSLPVVAAPRSEAGGANEIPAFAKEPATQPVKRHLDKIGRNDPCMCGSGKKYKKCCGQED
jgi:preprotein translocase subunit SecA